MICQVSPFESHLPLGYLEPARKDFKTTLLAIFCSFSRYGLLQIGGRLQPNMIFAVDGQERPVSWCHQYVRNGARDRPAPAWPQRRIGTTRRPVAGRNPAIHPTTWRKLPPLPGRHKLAAPRDGVVNSISRLTAFVIDSTMALDEQSSLLASTQLHIRNPRWILCSL